MFSESKKVMDVRTKTDMGKTKMATETGSIFNFG